MDLDARPVFRASLSLLPMHASGAAVVGSTRVCLRLRSEMSALTGAVFPSPRVSVGQAWHLHILAVGWTHAVLLTPSGTEVATLSLRGAPLAPPTLGDFTNDGLTDVILVRRNGCV
jgi:hypothetical protein